MAPTTKLYPRLRRRMRRSVAWRRGRRLGAVNTRRPLPGASETRFWSLLLPPRYPEDRP